MESILIQICSQLWHFIFELAIIYIHLHSSSKIVILVVAKFPVVMPSGKEEGSIEKLKTSSDSNMLSSSIEYKSDCLVCPGENVILYGPGP